MSNTSADSKRAPQHVFIIGSKGLGNYGGYETFVDHLTEMHQNNSMIKYHVACKANGTGLMDENKLPSEKVRELGNNRFEYHNADCFKITVPDRLGSAQALYYDISALKRSISYCKSNKIEHPIFYILACRIGPWTRSFKEQIHEIGGKLYVNPDGHEWMRAKWSRPVRWYWKQSEKLMVQNADLLVCDSVNIKKYIQQEYCQYDPKTVYISYGADIQPSSLSDDDPIYTDWLKEHDLKAGEYYLVVGRFVPENNFETMIREFMKSHTKRSLAIVTTQNNSLLNELDSRLHWRNDVRIKFVGSIYNRELLKKIREKSYGYLHGHSVGGTNPSLLEALGSTKLNLLYDVEFNREVGQNAALYWTNEEGNLAQLIDSADHISDKKQEEYGEKARKRIEAAYSWKYIANEYEKLWIGGAANENNVVMKVQ